MPETAPKQDDDDFTDNEGIEISEAMLNAGAEALCIMEPYDSLRSVARWAYIGMEKARRAERGR